MRPNRMMAGAGLAAPVLFAVMVGVQFLFRSDHDPVAWPISALGAGEHGWVQSATFAATGALLIVFAFGLHRLVARGGTGLVGPVLLALSGAGMLWAAVFPLGDYSAPFDPDGDPGLHPIGALLHFGVGAAGLIVLRWRLAADPAWTTRATYALVTGIAVVAYFALMSVLVVPDDAPLNASGGIAQAIMVVILHAGFFVLALRAMSLSAGASPKATTPPATV